MSYNNGPKITSDGLVFYIDAGNIKSYVGSGTDLYDLTKTGNTGSMTNGPVYSTANGGTITVDGVNDYIITKNLAAPFGVSTTESHFIWVYPTAAGQIVSEIGQPTINSGWHDSNIEINSGGVMSFSTWHGSLTNKVTSSALSFSAWYYAGFTYDGTTLTAYINGSSIGTTTFARQAPYNSGNGLYYGLFAADSTNMGTNAYAAGKFGAFMLYKKCLSASEVRQNYRAMKGRFGLV